MSKDIVKDTRRKHNKFIRERSRAYNAESSRVLAAYKEMTIDGKDDTEIIDTLCERFDITPRRCQNIIDRRGRGVNPKLSAMIDGKVALHLDQLDRAIADLREEYHNQLDELDVAENKGEKYFTVELVEVSGDKSERRHKRIPINKARSTLLDEIANLPLKFFGAVNKLIGSTNVNIFQRNELSGEAFSDIQKRIQNLERVRGVEPVEIVEGDGD
jgi:hypothetical protein